MIALRWIPDTCSEHSLHFVQALRTGCNGNPLQQRSLARIVAPHDQIDSFQALQSQVREPEKVFKMEISNHCFERANINRRQHSANGCGQSIAGQKASVTKFAPGICAQGQSDEDGCPIFTSPPPPSPSRPRIRPPSIRCRRRLFARARARRGRRCAACAPGAHRACDGRIPAQTAR